MSKVNKMKTLMVAFAAALLLAGGCKKEEKTEPAVTPPATDPAATDPAAAKPADPAQPAQPTEPAQPAAAATGDWIKVYGAHFPKNEKDPVEITVEKFTVKEAKFTDSKNLEGATAVLELDLNSIKSDMDKRDGHLKAPDYLDTATHGTATVTVKDVKKGAAEGEYDAQAEVAAHGMTKTFPVKFKVVESADDSVRVEGEHTFKRLDFGIGKQPDGENEKVADDVTIKLALTLKKSA